MLSGAAASLAAGTLAAEADQAPSFSPEYWACYHSRIEFESERLLRALETSDDDDPDFAVEPVGQRDEPTHPTRVEGPLGTVRIADLSGVCGVHQLFVHASPPPIAPDRTSPSIPFAVL